MYFSSRGGKENPSTVQPSYHYWSPWIGPKTRKSATVLNTESAKVHSSGGGSDIDVPLTEERLGDELLHLKVNGYLNCLDDVFVYCQNHSTVVA